MSKKNSQYTRQGVKNLDLIPGKSKGYKLSAPPEVKNDCPHRKKRHDDDTLETICLSCGSTWDYLGELHQ